MTSFPKSIFLIQKYLSKEKHKLYFNPKILYKIIIPDFFFLNNPNNFSEPASRFVFCGQKVGFHNSTHITNAGYNFLQIMYNISVMSLWTNSYKDYLFFNFILLNFQAQYIASKTKFKNVTNKIFIQNKIIIIFNRF